MTVTDEKKLKMALAEVIRSAGSVPGGHSAFAQVITETIEPNRLTLDVLRNFFSVRQLNVGDTLVKKVRRVGYPVRTLVPGTTHLSDNLYPPRQILNYQIDYLITKLRINRWELQNAELGTLQDWTNEMRASMVEEIIARVYKYIASVWDGTHSRTNFVDATSTGITTTIMDNMIETVMSRAGDVRAIVGFRSALLPLYAAGGIIEVTPSVGQNTNGIVALTDILMEWRRTGRLATYRGIPIVELPTLWRRTYDAFDRQLIDHSRVLVVGDQAGEVITYGEPETQESWDYTTEPADYILAMWQGYGLVIDMIENLGVIKVGAVDEIAPYAIA